MNGQRFRNKNATLWQTTNQTKTPPTPRFFPSPIHLLQLFEQHSNSFFEATRFDLTYPQQYYFE